MANTADYRRVNIVTLFMASLMGVAVNILVAYTNYISYYLTDIVGFGVIIAGSFITIFRIWDAVTDLGLGVLVDRTNSKFGKFRPYMFLGTILSIVSSQVMINVTPFVPEGTGRKVFFILMYLIFVLATTMMSAGVRATAQIMTDDPKQRATYGMMTGILLVILFSSIPIFVFSHLVPMTHGFNLQFFQILLNVASVVALICGMATVFAYRKHDVYQPDRKGSAEKITLKDSVELLTKNRPFLMLVLSAGTDKLATVLQSNATVVVIIYAIVAGNSRLSSAANSYTMIPSILMIVLGIGALGRKFGVVRSLRVSSWGGIIVCALSVALWIFGDPKTLAFPGYEGFDGWTFFTIAYLALWCLMKGFNYVATNSLTPMLADVIDYERYRSGKYRPGTVTALFSLADKIISSLGPTVIAILCAMIGFTDSLPTIETPYSVPLFAIGLLGMYGLAAAGLVINLICLKFYDLTPEKMETVRAELAKRDAATKA